MFAPVLRPTAAVATRTLLPGDPARALALAQELLDRPLMCNHHRGLWGYTGTAADGEPLTIQSTGLGGPSVAAVVADLAGLGVEVAIRVGTCRPVRPGPPPWGGFALGSLVAVRTAVVQDGTARALTAAPTVSGDRDLTDALAALARPAHVVSCDVLPGAPGDALFADRSTAAFFACAHEHGIRGAALLVVADESGDAPVDELARVAAAALGLAD